MNLQPGDWVRTESGEAGQVVHTARLTVFVQLEREQTEGEAEDAGVKAFLMSQLTRIDPPQPPTGPTTPMHD